jgi:peroxiredoxin Q/BCP
MSKAKTKKESPAAKVSKPPPQGAVPLERPAAGDLAPDFALPTKGGGRVSLAELRGRLVILYFYPKDDTPGCTHQAISFSEKADDFAAIGAVVIGVSRDSVAKHDAFARKHGLNLILASDEDGAVCGAYGVWKEKSLYGKSYMGVERSTFLIGRDGRVVQAWRKVKVAGHGAQVLAATRAAGAG